MKKRILLLFFLAGISFSFIYACYRYSMHLKEKTDPLAILHASNTNDLQFGFIRSRTDDKFYFVFDDLTGLVQSIQYSEPIQEKKDDLSEDEWFLEIILAEQPEIAQYEFSLPDDTLSFDIKISDSQVVINDALYGKEYASQIAERARGWLDFYKLHEDELFCDYGYKRTPLTAPSRPAAEGGRPFFCGVEIPIYLSSVFV